jgi:hypothetical protein
MSTAPAKLVICRECGASNYATSATCWICQAKLTPVQDVLPLTDDEPIRAELVYSPDSVKPRQGSSLLAVMLSTLAVGLSAVVLCGIGMAIQIFSRRGGGHWDDQSMLAMFILYVVLGGLLATAASLAVTPPKAGWNPAASFAARFTLSSLMLVALFPLLVIVLVVALIIALFITCLSGGAF